jgi:hypothetical protein
VVGDVVLQQTYQVTDQDGNDDSNTHFPSSHSIITSPEITPSGVQLGRWSKSTIEYHYQYDDFNSGTTQNKFRYYIAYFKDQDYLGIFDTLQTPLISPVPQSPYIYQQISRQAMDDVTIIVGHSSSGYCDKLIVTQSSSVPNGVAILRGKSNLGELPIFPYSTPTVSFDTYGSAIHLFSKVSFTSSSVPGTFHQCGQFNSNHREVEVHQDIDVRIWDGSSFNILVQTRQTGSCVLQASAMAGSTNPLCFNQMSLGLGGGADQHFFFTHWSNGTTRVPPNPPPPVINLPYQSSTIYSNSGATAYYYVAYYLTVNLYDSVSLGRVPIATDSTHYLITKVVVI